MGSFSASLRTIGDRRGLPATVTIDEGRIVIQAGDQPIGNWSLEEIHLESTGGSSYRMAAEGEQLLLDVPDTEAFKSAIEVRAKIRKRPKIRPEKAERPKARAEKSHVEKAPVGPDGGTGRARAPRTNTERVGGAGTSEPELESRLDNFLAAAERRWGSLLPAWVFTRIMVWALAAAIVLTVIFPGLVSSLLLVAGLLLVLLGAVAYTDQILAAKWLPGRMTPMHVLVVGVAVVLLGVLIGVIA